MLMMKIKICIRSLVLKDDAYTMLDSEMMITHPQILIK